MQQVLTYFDAEGILLINDTAFYVIVVEKQKMMTDYITKAIMFQLRQNNGCPTNVSVVRTWKKVFILHLNLPL